MKTCLEKEKIHKTRKEQESNGLLIFNSQTNLLNVIIITQRIEFKLNAMRQLTSTAFNSKVKALIVPDVWATNRCLQSGTEAQRQI